jgi:hypothetical protein
MFELVKSYIGKKTVLICYDFVPSEFCRCKKNCGKNPETGTEPELPDKRNAGQTMIRSAT